MGGIEAETMRASRARGIAAAAVVVLVLALVRPSLGQVARGRVTSWEIREASGLAFPSNDSLSVIIRHCPL